MNTLLPQVSDFIPVVRKFTIECRLCSISTSCRCNGGGHTHVQGENISRPGLRSCEPSVFRGDAWASEFHAADHGVNARRVSPRGFGVAAGFCVFHCGSRKEPQQRHWAPPTQTLLPSLFWTLVM